MRVKIQHRTSLYMIIAAVSLIFAGLMLAICYNVTDPAFPRMFMALFIVISVLAIVYGRFLQRILYTTVTIEKRMLKVDYPFAEKDIPVDCIKSLRFTHHTNASTDGNGVLAGEYRVRLDMELFIDGKTKHLSLNDKADRKIFNSGYGYSIPITDEEIPLYQIYRCLCDITGITGMDDIITRQEDI